SPSLPPLIRRLFCSRTRSNFAALPPLTNMATPAAAAASTMQPSPAAPKEQPPSGDKGAAAKKPPLNLANKPGEPTFQLKLDPSADIVLTWTKGVSSHVDMKITNTTPDPQSYKVKCTDNNIFRVRPPLGFVDPGQTQTIKIFQHSMSLPEANRHFFALYHKKCPRRTSRSSLDWSGAAK
ncbi:hypothetical protein PENTCL1PPCAC_10918, partial [Pristionchus entomophagus]